jgi:hypothetical protein
MCAPSHSDRARYLDILSDILCVVRTHLAVAGVIEVVREICLVVCREDNERTDERHRYNPRRMNPRGVSRSVIYFQPLGGGSSRNGCCAAHAERENRDVSSTSFPFKHGAFSRRQRVGLSNCSRQQISKILHDERRELVFAQFVYPFAHGLASSYTDKIGSHVARHCQCIRSPTTTIWPGRYLPGTRFNKSG